MKRGYEEGFEEEEEYLLDTQDLQQIVEYQDQQPPPSNPKSHQNTHLLQEMTLVKSRVAFDEQDFRARCHRLQSETCQLFKGMRVPLT